MINLNTINKKGILISLNILSMETFAIKALQLIVALGLLVVIHEFGHYFFARVFGIRVDKFYLFFNPWFSICKWKPKPGKPRYRKDGSVKTSWRDTEYGIGWVPLGGYCKIAGMIDESMDKEQMALPARPDEFRSRPAYQRLLVMVGGVLFNFLLAIAIYIGIAIHWGSDELPMGAVDKGFNFTAEAHAAGYVDGDRIIAADGQSVDDLSYTNVMPVVTAKQVTVVRGNDTIDIVNPKDFPLLLDHGFFAKEKPLRYVPVVEQLTTNGIAAKAGLKEGDRIVAVGETPIDVFDQLRPALGAHNDQEVTMTVDRQGQLLDLRVTPSDSTIGFMVRNPLLIYPTRHVDYNFFEAIPKGISDGTNQLVTYVGSLKYLFTKKGAQSVGGFGAIGDLFPARWNWYQFWQLCAFLSIILAFMNILPIPALDGGHVMFVLWEMITRRKPSDKFLEYAQMVGMFLLLALLLYANGNDIYRMIFK